MLFHFWGFPGGSVVKNLPAKAGDTKDMRSNPVLRTSPGVGNGNLLQYSWLENNPMDRGAPWPTIYGVTKSWIQLSTAQHLISTYLWIFQMSLWFWNMNSFWFLISFHWNYFVIENTLFYFSFLKFIETCFVVYPRECFMCTWEKYLFCHCWLDCSIYIKSSWFMVFINFYSLLIF